MNRLSLIISYLLIYLIISIDFFLILWVIIQHSFFSPKLFQHWQLGTLSVGSSVTSITSLQNVHFLFLSFFFCLFRISLSFGITKCCRIILYISCLSPRISHFSKEPWFLLPENGILKRQTCLMSVQVNFYLVNTAVFLDSIF